MNKRQTDKITSYAALKITIERVESKSIGSELPAFERGTVQFCGSLNVLAALEQQQGMPTKGIAVDKNRLAESVINRALEIGGAVAAYASGIGDAKLEAQVSFSKSALKELRDSQLDDRAQAVHDIAAGLVAKGKAAMKDCGLDATKLTDLQSAITAYSAMVASPRAAIAGKAAITTAIDGEFARADPQLATRQAGGAVRDGEFAVCERTLVRMVDRDDGKPRHE